MFLILLSFYITSIYSKYNYYTCNYKNIEFIWHLVLNMGIVKENYGLWNTVQDEGKCAKLRFGIGRRKFNGKWSKELFKMNF